MDELLSLLKKNARETPENLAKLLGLTVAQVKKRMADFEQQGIIRGYQAMVNEDALGTRRVTAVIEVKVTPERAGGFDLVARRISKFPEVDSVYLMSGTFDLLLFVSGSELKEVASFVSEKLATLKGVISTSTHFMLKTYKDHGVLMAKPEETERLKVSP
jgi:DNA-binding Lrp family transcriptional regulator